MLNKVYVRVPPCSVWHWIDHLKFQQNLLPSRLQVQVRQNHNPIIIITTTASQNACTLPRLNCQLLIIVLRFQLSSSSTPSFTNLARSIHRNLLDRALNSAPEVLAIIFSTAKKPQYSCTDIVALSVVIAQSLRSWSYWEIPVHPWGLRRIKFIYHVSLSTKITCGHFQS